MADNGSDEKTTVPPARPYAWPKLAIATLALALVGLGVWFTGSSGSVATVRITRHGLVPDLTIPDYYAKLTLKDETILETAALDDIPIGNGLNLDLPSPVNLVDIVQVELMDEDPLQDDKLDRADVSGRTCKGQTYAFEFIGTQSKQALIGMVTASIGGVGLVIAVMQFIRSQVL